jgi:signal transduction histidine kinase
MTGKANRLAEEQAALRRVATLVASSAQPEQVFQAVAEEAGRLLAARTAAAVRFDQDSAVIVGSWNDGEGVGIDVGTLVPYSDPDSPVYLASHDGGRIDDYADVPGEAARLTRQAGYRSSVMAPITAGGRRWGALSVFSASAGNFPADAQQRLADFTNLVALALESAEAHDQLTASRARIVEASVAERRRLERNLHDGAQQQLVSLALGLRTAQASVPPELGKLREELSHVIDGQTSVLDELREIAQGIHPANLAESGLGPALKLLARRSPIPVKLDVQAEARLPEPVEVAAYYVVSEALTNAAKHSGATVVHIDVDTRDDVLRVDVRDDGLGGADPTRGSGLLGLKDRAEAIGGTITLQSPSDAGTSLRVELPLDGYEDARASG